MRPEIRRRLDDDYEQFPFMYAGECVPIDEIAAAADRLGVPFSPEYAEFISLYGGGHARSLPVAGLRRWEIAGDRDWSVIELTEWYRVEKWPGTESWAVFSGDGFGNPIGLDAIGRVWLSDHDSCECVCLEAGFENWILRWALKAVERPPRGYLDRWSWPARGAGGEKPG